MIYDTTRIRSLPRSRLGRLAFASMLALLAACATTPRSSEPVTVRLIAFNDFHGNINPPASHTRMPAPDGSGGQVELPTGGVEYLSSLIARLKSAHERTVVVAAGDLVGASPLVASLFHHEPTIELLSAAGLEFTSVGNHEFDAGRGALERLQHGGCAAGRGKDSCVHGRFAGAAFRYLAANVMNRATGKPIFPGYAIRKFSIGGARLEIAFIGLVVKDTPNAVMPDGVAGLAFTDEADAANALVPELRARGVEAIVVLIHEGGTTSQTTFDDLTCPNLKGRITDIVSRLDPAIDAIVSGHTHRAYVCRQGGRLITSAGAEGRFVTAVDLALDPSTRDVTGATAQQFAVVNDTAPNPLPDRYPTLPKDPRLSRLVEFYNAKAAPLANREIGKIAADVLKRANAAGESPLGDLIADAQLAATRGAGAEIAFMNTGGVRTDLKATRGFVTYGDLFAVHPFGNGLVTLSLTGAQIESVLEQQWVEEDAMLLVSEGFTYEWDAAQPVGRRVDPASIRLNGTMIEPTRTYRVTVNEFLAQGGDGYKLLIGAPARVRGVVDVEALERYIAAHSPITVPPLNRVVRKN